MSSRETASNRLFLCKENSYSEKERETGRGRRERDFSLWVAAD